MLFNYACDLPMNFRISDSHSPKTSSLKTRCGVEEGLVHAGRGGKWWQCWIQVGAIWAQVELCWTQAVGHVGLCRGCVGRCWGHARPRPAHVGAKLAIVGAVLWPWAYVGHSWATLAPCNLACLGVTFAMLSQESIFDKNSRFARRERHFRFHWPLSGQCWPPAGAKLACLVAMLGPFWLMLGPMLPYVGPHWSHVVLCLALVG